MVGGSVRAMQQWTGPEERMMYENEEPERIYMTLTGYLHPNDEDELAWLHEYRRLLTGILTAKLGVDGLALRRHERVCLERRDGGLDVLLGDTYCGHLRAGALPPLHGEERFN